MKHQIARGFGLVEIMISIVLGLFLVAGLYTMLVSSQQSYSLGRANSGLSNSGQRVTQLIWNQLHQAGFINYQRRLLNIPLPATATWAQNQSIHGENDLTTEVKADTDRLTLRYRGSSVGDNDPANVAVMTADERMFDCIGNPVASTQLVEVVLYVNTSNELICDDNQNDPVVMEQNIESLQFRYRLSDDLQPFVTAADITNATDWANVVAIEFSLLAASPSGQSVQALQRDYILLDKTVTKAADKNLRQVLTGSITLKNLSVDG
jgi:prepilin-type N-terminal cleavage/methylation domain